jgi:malate dehydrogenase (oxaloacetate-decarboxylating)
LVFLEGRIYLMAKQFCKTMNNDPIIFALSNPEPEIYPSQALAGGAKVVATGRSDFPNQINNVSVFPSMLRVLLDLRVKTLNEELLTAVAKGIADLVDQEHLHSNYILPPIDDPRILALISDKLRKVIKLHINEN